MQLEVFADYFQFVVCDRDVDWSGLADLWNDDTVNARFASGGDYFAVGTVRNMIVPVEVVVSMEPPSSQAEEVVRTKLAVPSGELLVTPVTTQGFIVDVGRGTFDVWVQFFGLNTISDDGLTGDDRYVLWFVPAT